MAVKCYMTSFGVVIGEVKESIGGSDDITIVNPALIVSSNQGTGLADPMTFFVEKEMVVKAKDINSGPFTPITDILNHYSERFSETGLIIPNQESAGLILPK